MTLLAASTDAPTDPIETARAARLRYFPDSRPGIRRLKQGKHFSYQDATGDVMRDPDQLQRIKSLAIPPAWTDVWICPSAHGHLQATGRDVKGRKQYRYHARWRGVRDETKFARMIDFGEALPTIRNRTRYDLSAACLSREKVLATIVQLLDLTAIRIGNEEYARVNRSFGLTTFRTRHVTVNGATLRFHFRGKSGKEHVVDVHDRRLARAVKRCLDIPGHELFQYLDDDGLRQSVDSGDVNKYLRQTTEQDFTAKDFRTWTGTVVAAAALAALPRPATDAAAKHNVTEAIGLAADRLGNTVAICRKAYVHPAVLDAFLDGSLAATWQSAGSKDAASEDALQPEEARTLALLQRGLATELEERRI